VKVLFLTPIFPAPPDTGIRQRMTLTLTMLVSIGDVTLITHAKEADAIYARMGVLSLCNKVLLVPMERGCGSPSRHWVARLHRLADRLFDSRPMCIRALDSPIWHDTLSAVRPETFDLVWVQSLGLYGQLLPYHLRRVAVDLPDTESIKARRELRTGRLSARFAVDALDFLKLRHAERMSGADGHWWVVCSDNDRRHLSKADGHVWVVPNSVPRLIGVPCHEESDDELLYVGTFAYKPNRDAVLYFTRHILPLILRERPSARFSIVGADPTPDICALASYPRVAVIGSVPSVEPYLRRASVVIAPLLNGAGSRIKILEAMSHAKPVVATSIGAEGLAVQPGRNILLADTPSDFARSCLALLRSAALRAQVGLAGLAFVHAHHTTEHARNALTAFLKAAFSIDTAPAVQLAPDSLSR
jgi:polysaccharide biosynthesis protein PslH